MKTCASHPFSVSSMSVNGKTVATPTRHFAGTGCYQKCDLYGKEFKNSDDAHAAMFERGYSERFYSRSSVPCATFAKLAHVRLACRFDALYRLYKWQGRRGMNRLALRNRLAKMAKRVGIFHPATIAFDRKAWELRLGKFCSPERAKGLA